MRRFVFALGCASLFLMHWPCAWASTGSPTLRFEISFPRTTHAKSITGRVFLMISRKGDPEVRLQAGSFDTPPMFGLDVHALRPDEIAVVDASVAGYPLRSLRNLPAGDYYVQALLNVYTEFRRADGHTIWAHMDQWEGQQFNRSPGNLYSAVQRLHLDPAHPTGIRLSLSETIPPIAIPADTEWVKRVRIQSKLLTKFWGRPMHLGAVVLLPRGYADHPDTRYPVIYKQGHFSLAAPFGFTPQPVTETDEQRRWRENLGYENGHEFYEAWTAEGFPRVLAVTFQHPTPYYDNSFAMDSANSGPYGEAITTELIPYIEQRFRAIGQPHARALTGGSAGGQQSLALQLQYPHLFAGAWIFCPAEIDFRRYYSINLHEDRNAFLFEPFDVVGKSFHQQWPPTERAIFRTDEGQPGLTVRQLRQLESVLGSHGRGALWFDASEAVFSPVAHDGYPRRVFDPDTGEIDKGVVDAWRQLDLRDYAERNWPTLGPQLRGKLNFFVGDMDEYFCNLEVYLFEAFLASTSSPHYPGSFQYGRPGKGHMWTPLTHAQLVRVMAEHMTRNAPDSSLQRDRAAIEALLDRQQQAWNEGDTDAFLDAYRHSDELTFVGSEGVTRGWTALRERYRRGGLEGRSVGTLRLSDFDITPLESGHALVIGRWQLTRRTASSQGVFSLVLQRFAEGWRIIHDHSSETRPAGAAN